MRNELYFIPILIDAFHQSNQQEALIKAFQQIEEKGNQDEYQVGYTQFKAFMNQAEASCIEESLVEIDKEFVFTPDSEASIRLLLFCDEQSVGTFDVGKQSSKTTFDRIQPGFYQLRTETGWVIWEELLNEADLLWSRAFPNQPLLLAADTDSSQQASSKTFYILVDTLLIQIHPGPEFGSLFIQYNPEGMGR